MPVDLDAVLREFDRVSAEVPDPDDDEDPDTYAKRIGAIDVTEKSKGLGVIIGLGRWSRK